MRKSNAKIPQNDGKEMVRSWTKISLHQYEQLKKLKEKTGKPLSEIIREAVSQFIKKKEYPINIAASHLPKATSDKYKTMNAYFSKSDWNFLVKISENTGRSKTNLVREAIEDSLVQNQR